MKSLILVLCNLFCLTLLCAQNKEESIKAKIEKPTTTATKKDSFKLISVNNTIYAPGIQLHEPFFKNSYIIADGKKYDITQLEFYSCNQGHFQRFKEAVSKSKTKSKSESKAWGGFYHRETAGKINMYSKIIQKKEEKIDTKWVPDPKVAYMHGSFQRSTSVSYRNLEYLYFQVGDEAPQPLMFKTLEKHLKDNQKSMVLFKKAKNNNKLIKSLIYGGALIAGYGIYDSQFRGENASSNPNSREIVSQLKKVSPFSVLGVGCIGASYFIKRPKKLFKEAIDTYNAAKK